MSEGVIIALVGMGGTIGGAVVSQLFSATKNRLEAYRLAQEMQATTNACGNGTARWLTTSTRA